MGEHHDDSRRRSTGGPRGDDEPVGAWRDDHPTPEALAAFLDASAFDPADRAAIERHLPGCAACSAVLAELRALVTALADLPEPAVPRSFALTRAMLEQRDLPHALDTRRPVDLERVARWRRRQIAAVRYATAVAAVLFVLVLGADLLTTTSFSGGGDADVSSLPETSGQTFATDTPVGDEGERSAAPAQSEAAPAEPQPTEASIAAAAAPTATPPGGEAVPTPATAEDTLAIQATEQPTEQDQPQVETKAANDVERDAGGRRSGWRTLEFGLALLLAWLLAALVILPRIGAGGATRE